MPTITWTCVSCQRRDPFEVDTLRISDLNGGGWEEPEQEHLCGSCYRSFESRFPRSRKIHPDETLAGFLLNWLWLADGLEFSDPPASLEEFDEIYPEDRRRVTKLLTEFGRPIAFPIQNQGFSLLVESLSGNIFAVAWLGEDGRATIQGCDDVAAFKYGDSVNAFAFYPDGSKVPGRFSCLTADEEAWDKAVNNRKRVKPQAS